MPELRLATESRMTLGPIGPRTGPRLKTMAERQAEGIEPIRPLPLEEADKLRHLLANLTAQSKQLMCNRCLGDITVAWFKNLGFTATWALRCPEGFSPELIEEKLFMAKREGELMLERRPEQGMVVDGSSRQMAPAGPVEATPIMTIEQFDQRQDLMEHVVNRMKDGVHYGLIPGTSDKTLFEPGAEYLRAAYNIQWQIDLVDQREDFVNHEYYYRYKAYQILSNGMAGPSWENSAWSKERKFWCKSRECPRDCLGDHGPRGMEAQMLPNNVRDRAYKRAFVAMIRNVTGATGLFKMGGMDHRDQGDDLAGGEEHARGVEGDHPWLVTCPIHKVDWMMKGNMPEPAHKQGQGWCNQSKALRDLLSKKLQELTAEWDPKAVNIWLKSNHGSTFSTFSSKQKIDILTEIKSLGPDGAPLQPVASDGSPVDTETGAIMDTTAAPEVPVQEDPPPPPDEGPPPPIEGSPPTETGSEPDWMNDPLRKK